MLQRLQQPQRVGRVGCVGLECIQRPMEHFFNAPETNWDRVDRLSKESKPILFVFGLIFLCLLLVWFWLIWHWDAFSWGPFGPDQSEEAGAYTPGRVIRSLSWRRVEHCYCYWLHSFGKKHIDTKLHSRILHSVVPVQEMAQGFSLGLVSSLGFSRRRVGMDESSYSCGGSFVVLDHCTLIHSDSSLYILLLSWSRSSPSSKPWFLGFHADTKRQHADYISLETVNTSWDTSNGRQEMHWRNTKTT